MRKTDFRWKNKDGSLTAKAKTHLSKAMTSYWALRKERGRKIAPFKEPERIRIKFFKKGIVYFVNFRIFEIGFNPNNKTGVYGSLISPHYIPLEQAKTLIKNALPVGYTPTGFYEAQDEGEQKHTELLMYRDDYEFFSEVLD